MYTDGTGYFAVSILVIGLIAGAIIGATAGGIAAYNIAEDKGAEGWELVGWTTAGVLGGAVIGGAVGYGSAAIFSSATGIIGVSVSKGYIGVVTKTVAIGHFPQYVIGGSASGYSYFSTSQDTYKLWESQGVAWTYNSQYIRDCISLGSSFQIFQDPARAIESGPNLVMEIQLIIEYGYYMIDNMLVR